MNALCKKIAVYAVIVLACISNTVFPLRLDPKFCLESKENEEECHRITKAWEEREVRKRDIAAIAYQEGAEPIIAYADVAEEDDEDESISEEPIKSSGCGACSKKLRD